MDDPRTGRTTTIFFSVVAIVIGIVSFVVGASISQPMLLAQPTREVLSQADNLDRILLAELHDPRDITEDINKLKTLTAKIPTEQGADINSAVDALSSRLAEQNSSFQQNVWKAHEAITAVRLRLTQQAYAASNPATVAYDQLRRFLKWTGPVLALGLVLAVPALIFAVTNPKVRAWLARTTSVGVGPISWAGAVGDMNAVKQGIKARFDEVDDAIVKTYKDKIEKSDLEGMFKRLKAELDMQIEAACGVRMANIRHRATMYVPGFTDEQLVQVTKYLPAQDPERVVIGRRFSVRYGIIGRAFRLRTALYNWEVNNEGNQLVRYWGLTRGEAYKQGAEKTSLMALPIPPDQTNDPLAIIYIEAKGSNQLMPKENPIELRQLITADPNGRTQADFLASEKIWKPLWSDNRVQPLYEALQSIKAEMNWDAPLRGQDGQ